MNPLTFPAPSLIIPCYNEASQLPETGKILESFLNTTQRNFEIIFVDDGSTDDTRIHLEKISAFLRTGFPHSRVSVLHYFPNRGKGYAIQTGIVRATSPFCLTLDADMSATPDEFLRWQDREFLDFRFPAVYIGSRESGLREGRVKYHLHRRIMGQVFNIFVRIFLKLKVEDSQCGFKLYPSNLAKEIFTDLSDYGFAHDVEVLLRLKKKNIPIISLPVRWAPKGNSKVRLISDSVKMLKAVFRLRKKYA